MKNAVETLVNEPVTMSGHLRAVRKDTGRVWIMIDTVTVQFGSHTLFVEDQVVDVIDTEQIPEDWGDSDVLDAWRNSEYGVS